MIIESDSLEMTHDIGRRLGAVLISGDVVALIGPLGSGKTALVRGMAEGAGVSDPREVNSPTFIIVNEYEAPAGKRTGVSAARHDGQALRIYHIDTYRLRHWADLDALGFDEMLAQGAVLVEWADRVEPLLPPDRLMINLEAINEHRRRFHLAAGGPRSQTLLESL